MKNESGQRRWLLLKNQLERQIVSGRFEFNQRFSSIQQIADEFHVSYLTANKAMKSLEKDGYLHCKNGVGHFVSYVAEETALPQKIVQFIMSQREYRERESLFIDAAELFRRHGWRVRILKCPISDISPLFTEINSPDAYSIICGLHIPWQHFQASFGHMVKRVLILGALAGNSEITSIISDEYETIRQAMAHFEKMNRRNVAIIAGYPTRELEALRLGAWRSAVLRSGHSLEWIKKHTFSFAGDQQSYSWEKEYPRLLTWLQSIREDTDGLIVPVHHAAVIAACLRCGLDVPRKLSLLLIARTSPVIPSSREEFPYETVPDIDVLDHNYAGHFQCALEILEECSRSGEKVPGCWYFCPPGTIQKCRKATV